MDLTRCQKSKKTQNGQMSLTANMNGTAALVDFMARLIADSLSLLKIFSA